MRRSLRMPIIWYRDPVTGQVHHTGAKVKRGRTGRKFCSVFRKSISANNFWSQHVDKVHPDCKTSQEVWRAILRYVP